MIIKHITDSNPRIYQGHLRAKIQGVVLPTIPTSDGNDTCYCELECKYIESVFAKPSGEWWQNDKNSFLYRKLLLGDSVQIKLYKNDEELTTITDNTLGVYTNGFAAQPLYIGFVIDWELVYSIHGVGIYQIKTETNIVGLDSTIESQKFELMLYSDYAADKTVKLEIVQNGNIIGSEFDFTDLEWTWNYRIKGKLTKENPELEIDNYLASNYKVEQIQDKLIRNWTLETHLLPSILSNLLSEDNILGNEIKLTDYNIMNNEIYRRISLYPKNIEVKNFNNNRKKQITIQFTDKIDNFIKRNF